GGLRPLPEECDRGGEIVQHARVGQLAHPAEHRVHVGKLRRALAAVEVDSERAESLAREAPGDVTIVLAEPSHVRNQDEPRMAAPAFGLGGVRLRARPGRPERPTPAGYVRFPPFPGACPSDRRSGTRGQPTSSQSPYGSSNTAWRPAARAPRTSTEKRSP